MAIWDLITDNCLYLVKLLLAEPLVLWVAGEHLWVALTGKVIPGPEDIHVDKQLIWPGKYLDKIARRDTIFSALSVHDSDSGGLEIKRKLGENTKNIRLYGVEMQRVHLVFVCFNWISSVLVWLSLKAWTF